jgi:hypothetical protein
MTARATFRDDHNPRSMILESYLRYRGWWFRMPGWALWW